MKPKQTKQIRTDYTIPQDKDGKIPVSEAVATIYKRYLLGMESMQRSYPFLNNKSPIQYFADNRLRFNVFLPQRDPNTKNWRTMYRSAIVRNKILGVIAHQVSMMNEPSLQAQNAQQDEDVMASQFFKDTVEWTQDHEDWEIKKFWGLVTATVEGTVIFKDDYGVFEREVKEIVSIDEETGKIKSKPGKIKDFEGAFTEIIPNDELLVANPFVFDIQEQPWIIRRRRMPIEEAKRRYGKYNNFEKVMPGSPSQWIYSSDLFMPYRGVSYLAANMVEVIEHWDKDQDLYQIAISGEEITPQDHPNPRKDKKYPFVKSGFEPIDYGFFWCKSLADKLSPEQDVYDAFVRMIVDRQHLRNIPPLLTNNPALVNEDIIIPNQITYVGNLADYKVEPVGVDQSSDAGTGNILQLMQGNLNTSSLDPMATGSAPEGGTPTATQALQMAQGQRVMMGLFGWMYGYLITEWTKLRCKTILSRFSADFPWEKITLNNRILKSGKMGKRTYVFDKGLASRTTEEKMKIAQKIQNLQNKSGGKHEIVAVDPDELMKLDLYIKIDSAPKPKVTDAVSEARAKEKWITKVQTPQIWNLQYAARDLARAWNEDPDESVNAEQTQGGMEQAAQQTPASPQPQGTPMMDQMNNSLNARMGLPTKAMNRTL